MPKDLVVRTHSLEDYVFVLDNYDITGYGEGDDVVKFIPDDVLFKKKVGAKGARSRALLAKGEGGKFELKLLSTNPDNAFLSRFLINQSKNRDVPKIAMLKDGRGKTLISTNDAWIEGWVENAKGEDTTELTWTIDCGKCDTFYGESGL